MTLKQVLSQYAIQAVPYLFALAIAGLTWLRTHVLLKNKAAEAILDRVIGAVDTAVQAVEQTTVPVLKAKSGGGTLTAADAVLVKNEAMQMARDHLGGGQWIAVAQKILGVADFQKFLADHVEAAVQRLSTPPAAPPKP